MIDYTKIPWPDLIVSRDVWDEMGKLGWAGRLPNGISPLGHMAAGGVSVSPNDFLGTGTICGMTERGRWIVKDIQLDDLRREWLAWAEGHCPK